MRLSFLTPEAALLAVGALVPIALLVDSERRARIVRIALALVEPAARGRRALTVALATVLALLGLAAAQPVLALETSTEAREDTEVFFVLDISRSMLASSSLAEPTRFDRAAAEALAIRRDLREVRAGIASVTDRMLPHLFPTDDAALFAATLGRSVGVERPPPGTTDVLSTSLYTLTALANRSYFTRQVRNRIAVVLTDAETKPFSVTTLGRILQREPAIDLFVVRYGSEDERVYTLAGTPESGYTPDPDAGGNARAIAAAAGGLAFDEGRPQDVARAVRDVIGRGVTRVSEPDRREIPLAPYVAALAFLPLALVLWRRNL